MPRKITTLKRASDLMCLPGRALLQTNTCAGKMWAIMPDGVQVADGDVPKIIERNGLIGMSDSLWPGLSQTYRRP
jgi:hypothetical protein